jgi:hypothetical protein
MVTIGIRKDATMTAISWFGVLIGDSLWSLMISSLGEGVKPAAAAKREIIDESSESIC